MLRPLTLHQYSIYPSPVVIKPSTLLHLVIVSVIYDVRRAPAHRGYGRTFEGVVLRYLVILVLSSKIHCFVRSSNTGYHLQQDTSTPIIMNATGTGTVYMHGFLQESLKRAVIAEGESRKLGPSGAVLRSPGSGPRVLRSISTSQIGRSERS
ncbi:hypothetical protein F5X99DRAFT_427145 [Biscogniauxia marginata]|nr:hypothetical protein F5X99DRAFT_427145 [Biscogniauxia marginata]